jgi:hypothetical protein
VHTMPRAIGPIPCAIPYAKQRVVHVATNPIGLFVNCLTKFLQFIMELHHYVIKL